MILGTQLVAITLRWRGATTLAVEAEGLLPERLAGLSLAQVERLPLAVGNTTLPAAELFEIGGRCNDDTTLVFEGDLSNVARLGETMSAGVLRIEGDAGPHVGSGMSGGVVEVTGSTGDWAGAAMRGGRLTIRGRAGDYLGAAYPGARIGMRSGEILVHGDAGDDAGMAMRRGLIAVVGQLGTGAGRGMVAGSIFVFGGCGPWAGAAMKRGTIALLGGAYDAKLLPTFIESGVHILTFLNIYIKHLMSLDLTAVALPPDVRVRRYNGDTAQGGRGEVLVAV